MKWTLWWIGWWRPKHLHSGQGKWGPGKFHGRSCCVSTYVKWQFKLLPHRVCCHWLSAMPAQHMKAPKQAQEDTSPAKIDVTSKSPVGDISVVTLIRTDTTLDHSQKAEKVWDESVRVWEWEMPLEEFVPRSWECEFIAIFFVCG